MSKKPKRQTGSTPRSPIKVWADDDFRIMLRKYRAQRELKDEPISSDEKAIILLAERGYKAEILTP